MPATEAAAVRGGMESEARRLHHEMLMVKIAVERAISEGLASRENGHARAPRATRSALTGQLRQA